MLQASIAQFSFQAMQIEICDSRDHLNSSIRLPEYWSQLSSTNQSLPTRFYKAHASELALQSQPTYLLTKDNAHISRFWLLTSFEHKPAPGHLLLHCYLIPARFRSYASFWITYTNTCQTTTRCLVNALSFMSSAYHCIMLLLCSLPNLGIGKLWAGASSCC